MSEWIEWKGGKCPVADTQAVVVRLRNGAEIASRRADSWSREHYPDSGGNIVAYRLVDTAQDANATQVGGDHYKWVVVQPGATIYDDEAAARKEAEKMATEREGRWALARVVDSVELRAAWEGG